MDEIYRWPLTYFVEYTTIADRLRTVSGSNNSHPTGVFKPAYERFTFPFTAKVLV